MTHIPTIHVPAIGGQHQFAHFLPVAFELAESHGCRVLVFTPSHGDAHKIAELAESLGRPVPDMVIMKLPRRTNAMVPDAARKLAMLLTYASRIRDCDAILCAERTSTILKRLPGRCPPLFHIPHGAGDRAVGFENRFEFFDKVFVSGAKDRDRLLLQGCVAPEDCVVGGSVKLGTMIQLGLGRPPLFANDRPVILYNPHFDRRMGTGETMARRLVETVCAGGKYNLVIAPHVRMARGWSDRRKARWQALEVPERVIVDLGSDRSSDMSYTLAADLYVGDVSSQVYEYLVRPRPCLFVNGHGADWQDNPDYAMWRFGTVIEPDEDLPRAIELAFESWPFFRKAQRQRTMAAFDGIDWDASGEIRMDGPDPAARIAEIIAQDVRRGDGMPVSDPAAFSSAVR